MADPAPLQGLAAWLRAFSAPPTAAADGRMLRRWADEVDADSRAQEAPALMQSDIDAMRKMQAEYDSLAERWREARPYSQEVANLHATFKAFDSRLGKLIEGGLFKRVLASIATTSPPLPAAPEQQLHPRLKDTPYGPAILLDDARDAERMDWLERQDLNDIATIRQTNSVVGINVGSGPFYGKTLRAAIDAAIAAAPKEPE